ncbi:MAG: ABC transporter permease [Ruminococcaceae bacterium]|nr:ABC transporter permease [Oscillospiraceae bacterium]
MKALKRFYLGLVLLFLYAPIAVLIVFSFNTEQNRSQMQGFSLKWYVELFEDEMLLTSLGNTLLIAAMASVIATIIGTYAALIIGKMKPFAKTTTMSIVNIPIINAEIVTGISLMMLFVFLSIPLGFTTLLIAHVAFNVPYVVLSVMPKIRQLNRSTYEAALDLGASHAMAFRKVVLPDIMPGVISGLLLSFTMSLDDFIISYFTTGPGFPTLSVTINTMTKKSVPLSVNALSTLMFVVVFAIMLFINLRKPAKKGDS